jgi:hypothetical protein
MTPTSAGYASARLRAPVGDVAASSHGSPVPGIRIGTATFALQARVRGLTRCVSDDHGDPGVIQAARAMALLLPGRTLVLTAITDPDGRVRPGV